MLIQGRLERTKTTLMHFKCEVTNARKNKPHTFYMGQHVISHLQKKCIVLAVKKALTAQIFLNLRNFDTSEKHEVKSRIFKRSITLTLALLSYLVSFQRYGGLKNWGSQYFYTAFVYSPSRWF